MQQKLAHKEMCIGEHVTGIVGCFALYPCTQITSLYYKYIKTTQLCVGVCVCVCVCVSVCARDNVCDILANDAYAYKC